MARTLRDLEEQTLLIELANKNGKCGKSDRGLATLKASVLRLDFADRTPCSNWKAFN